MELGRRLGRVQVARRDDAAELAALVAAPERPAGAGEPVRAAAERRDEAEVPVTT